MFTKKQILISLSWNSVAKVTSELLLLAQLAIVARYIDKVDFGIMSIVHVILGLTAMFTDFGMWAAMMHKQNITDNQYRSLYWFNWFLNIAVFLVLSAVSFGVAEFYNDSRLVFFIILAGLRILISPFGKIYSVIKNKELDFKFISIVSVVSNIITFIITTGMCLLHAGIYSLIIPGLITSLIVAIVYSVEGRKHVRITFHYQFSEIKDFFRIGLYDTGAQLMDYLSYKVDVLLVGKFFGMETLGLYNMGKELALKTMKVIAPIINPIITPILAKMQDDDSAVKMNYLRLLNFISFLNFPILMALCVFAEPVVHLFFSAKYADAAVFVQILCFWGLFASIGNPAGNLVIAKGRTDLSFKWTIIRFCCVPITVYLSSFFSVNAIAYSQVLLQLVFFVIYWRMLIYPLTEITLREYVGAMSHSFFCAIIAAIPSLLFSYYWQVYNFLGLLLGCFLFGVIYLLSTYYFNRNQYQLLISLIKK